MGARRLPARSSRRATPAGPPGIRQRVEEGPGDVVLEGQDRGSDEQHQEPVEDEQVTEPGERVAAADERMVERRLDDAAQAPALLVEQEGAAAPAVLEGETCDSPDEDGRRDDDEPVPEPLLPAPPLELEQVLLPA